MRAGRAVTIRAASYAIQPDHSFSPLLKYSSVIPKPHVLSKQLVPQASGFSDQPFQSKLEVRCSPSLLVPTPSTW
jgi:hypothetical protein